MNNYIFIRVKYYVNMKFNSNLLVMIIIILLSTSFSLSTQAINIHYTGHAESVNDAQWSPDETTIASGSVDGQIILWNSSTGEIISYAFDNFYQGRINSVRWNSDGTKILASHRNSTVYIWDVSTENIDIIKLPIVSVSVNIADWSFDDLKIAIGTDTGKVLVFESLNGNLQNSLDFIAGSIIDLAFNPVRDLIAISYANGSVIIWNNHSNETKKIDYTNVASSLSWTSDGSILVVGENLNIHFLSETGEEQASINDVSSSITALHLNNNESLLATVSSKGIVNIWNIQTYTKIKSFDVNPDRESSELQPFQINSLDWNKDDKLLITSTSRQFDLWDISTEKNELVYGTAETSIETQGITIPAISLVIVLLIPMIRKNKK